MMRKYPCISAGWRCLFFLIIANTVCASQSSTHSAGTCAARTVNYLTHSLPQQCHKSSWSSPTATDVSDHHSASSNVGTSVAAHETVSATDASIIPSSTTIGSHSKDNEPSHSEEPAASQLPPSPTTILEAAESDADSALGNSNFLSFEEWKKQNLAKHGQSAEHVGKKQPASNENRKGPSNIHTELDSLGDDGEIDLNFGSFSAERPESPDPLQWGKPIEDNEDGQSPEDEVVPRSKARNKDAGTTCKERFNYASFDCAATILKTNLQASGAVSVLIEKNRDSYMLNECSAENKFIILELCDDIAVDTIVLANFEFFSSTFRTFRVSVSDRYPVKMDKWKTLGTYEARNSREIQAFLVENPLIWARYLRIEFLTHYGNEFYCPVSLVRVHGTTMMEDYKHDEVAARAEEEDEQEESELEADVGEKMLPEAVAQPILDEQASKSSTTESHLSEEATPTVTIIVDETETTSAEVALETSPYTTGARNESFSLFCHQQEMCGVADSPEAIGQSTPEVSPTKVEATNATAAVGEVTTDQKSTPPVSSTGSVSVQSDESAPTYNQTSEEPSSTNSSTMSSTTPSKVSHTDTSKTTSTSTQPHPANPTIQESFFKSVQKRLQQLESNSTLSLQYIESQSLLLRDAFSKIESKQIAKTTTFLSYLNSTVLNELRDFRQQYDQIWQSTVIELETQRELYQREVLAMNTRLGILADEVVFQKRMSILQSILVLLCLGLVLFSRGALNTYLGDLNIVQNVMARSQTFRFPASGTLSGSESPSGSPIYAGLSKFGYRRHQRDSSDDTTTQDLGSTETPVDIVYSPPSPPPSQYDGTIDEVEEAELSEDTYIEGGDSRANVIAGDELQRPRSSPGILTTAAMETTEQDDSTTPRGSYSNGQPPAEPVSTMEILEEKS